MHKVIDSSPTLYKLGTGTHGYNSRQEEQEFSYIKRTVWVHETPSQTINIGENIEKLEHFHDACEYIK